MTSAAADRFMWKSPSLLLASSFLLERVAPMHFSVLPSSLLLCKKYFTVFCLSEQKDSKFSQQQHKIHYPFFQLQALYFAIFLTFDIANCINKELGKLINFLICLHEEKGCNFRFAFPFRISIYLFLSRSAIFAVCELSRYSFRKLRNTIKEHCEIALHR